MKKALDFNKLKKAHNAKKKWEELQKEQDLEKSDLDLKQDSSNGKKEANPNLRKTS